MREANFSHALCVCLLGCDSLLIPGMEIGNAVLTATVSLWHGSVQRLSERSIFLIY